MAYYAPGTIIPSKLHLYQTSLRTCDVFPFLKLPGEIRNKIYDLVFDGCWVEVRLGSQQQDDNETFEQPLQVVHIQPQKQNERETPAEVQKRGNMLPEHKIRQIQSSPGLKQQKHTSQLLQNQVRTEPQKRFKTRHRGRACFREAAPRMSHTIVDAYGRAQSGTSPDHRVQFNFLLSSRKIYNEALCVLYAKTSFRFLTTNAINAFLSKTPWKALRAIQEIDISHATAPEPELTKHRHMKVSIDRSWARTCRQIRGRITDLKKLRLHLELNDWPSQLGLHEEWAQSILFLRGKGLDRVEVVLLHYAFSGERLYEAARNLEVAMMSREGRLAKFAQEKKMMEAKKEAKKKKTETKARKVLVIKMDNIPAVKQAPKA